MRTKLLLMIFIFLILSLTAVLLIKEEKPLVIITSPKIYSYSKTDDYESFNISILANNIDSFYFDLEFINNAVITNDDKNKIIPIEIMEISNNNEVYLYNEEIYNVVSIRLKVSVGAVYLLEEISDAVLTLTYDNNKSVELYIGEFNYLIQNQDNNDIGLSNLYVTHGYLNDSNTATGLYLELSNESINNIYIKEIKTIGKMVSFDNFYLKRVEEEIPFDQEVKNILNLEAFNHFRSRTIFEQRILMTESNSVKLYVPFLYHGEINQIYRFPIVIVYEIEGVEYEYIIDDFPFINTSSFKEELESGYITHEIGN